MTAFPTNSGRSSAYQIGATYIALLFVVAMISAGLAVTAMSWSQQRQREKEQELIWIGNQFREAIARYYEQSPGTAKQYPDRLEDLLADHRYLTTQRYLRRIYRDPITGTYDWGLVRGVDGKVIGVFSKSEGRPTRRHLVSGHIMKNYYEWRFMYVPL